MLRGIVQQQSLYTSERRGSSNIQRRCLPALVLRKHWSKGTPCCLFVFLPFLDVEVKGSYVQLQYWEYPLPTWSMPC